MSHHSLFKSIIAIAALLGLGALLASNLSGHSTSIFPSGRLADIKNRGTLIVATDATYPPLESIDDKGGFFGLDIDIAKEIAADLGVKLVLRNILWDDIFQSLKNGEVDIVASSVTITPERAALFSFSDPYFNAGQVIVSTTDKRSILSSPQKLKGLRVGVQPDTTSSREAQKYTDPALVFSYHDYKNAKEDLENGKIDALVMDYPAAVALVSNDKKIDIIGDIFTQEFYGIVAQKNQTALTDQINKTIRRLKQGGTIRNLEQKWLGR